MESGDERASGASSDSEGLNDEVASALATKYRDIMSSAEFHDRVRYVTVLIGYIVSTRMLVSYVIETYRVNYLYFCPILLFIYLDLLCTKRSLPF